MQYKSSSNSHIFYYKTKSEKIPNKGILSLSLVIGSELNIEEEVKQFQLSICTPNYISKVCLLP